MSALPFDLRYAFRSLRKNLGFAAVAVLLLALGIGANSAIFSVVNAVLLRPLPYPDPNRLVRVFDEQSDAGLTPADFAEFQDWRQGKIVFDDVAALFSSQLSLAGQAYPVEIPATRISANLLPMLGIQPLLGRGFRPEEEARNAERVCLITRSLWQRQFGGDPSILGRSLTLSDLQFTVIGIVRDLPDLNGDPQILYPLRLNATIAPRGLHFITIFARLRPSLSLQQAQSDLFAIAERLKKERSITHGIRITPLQEDIVQGASTPLWVLLGAVGFVLLIACANLASLFLSRGQDRRREIAIRVALGAPRSRILGLLLTESVTLALLGGALGLLLGYWGVDALLALGLDQVPRAEGTRLDFVVLAFTFAVSVLTGTAFGLYPALEALRRSSADTLKVAGQLGGSRAGPQRSALVVSEVALSLVLLVGAGLLLRSFIRLTHVEKGFRAAHVLTFDVRVSQTRYAQPARQQAFFTQYLERLRNLPGVEAAGLTSSLMLSGDNTNGGVSVEGWTDPSGANPFANKRVVSPDYFRAMEIPLRRGRFFAERDVQGAPPVAIINESFARRYFPNQDPIGRRVGFLWGIEGMQEVVGIVGDVRHDTLASPPFPEIYVAYSQRPDAGFNLVVRTSSEPASLTSAAREALRQLDPALPMAHVRTMDEVVSRSVSRERLGVVLLVVFSLMALLLAAVGLYGVIAYGVTQRNREIGIRMALGASPADVLRTILGQGIRLAALGAAIGIVAALVLTRFLASLLFEIRPTDPLTFGAITLILFFVALVASLLPARRATRVDPMIALRYE